MSESEMNFDLHTVSIEIDSLYKKENLRQKKALVTLVFNLIGFSILLVISVVMMQSHSFGFWFTYSLVVAFFILRLFYLYRKKERSCYEQLCKDITRAVN